MKKGAVILTVIMAVLLLPGCTKKSTEEASVQSVSMICGFGSVGQTERFAGVTVPRSETKINKSEDQVVAEVRVKAGDEVKKDQVLFVYDTEQTTLNLEKARLELEQLKNTVTAKNNERASLEAEKAGAGADQQLSYTLEIQEVDTAIMEANYNISLKEKEIQKMEETRNHLEVKSPVDGHVQSINAEGATDNYGNPLPYMTVVETGSYRVNGYVNENNAAAVQEGQPVIVRSRVDDSTWKGTVTKIEWENPVQSGNSNYYYGPGDSDTTTVSNKYPFYVELESDEGLILGQHVYIEPDYGQGEGQDESQVQLPAYYINDLDGTPWVWAQNEKGELEKRKVETGAYDEETDTYVIENGLELTDYIAFPAENLKEGMKCVKYDESAFDAGETEEDMSVIPEESGMPGVDGDIPEESGMPGMDGDIPEESGMPGKDGDIPEDMGNDSAAGTGDTQGIPAAGDTGEGLE